MTFGFIVIIMLMIVFIFYYSREKFAINRPYASWLKPFVVRDDLTNW